MLPDCIDVVQRRERSQVSQLRSGCDRRCFDCVFIESLFPPVLFLPGLHHGQSAESWHGLLEALKGTPATIQD